MTAAKHCPAQIPHPVHFSASTETVTPGIFFEAALRFGPRFFMCVLYMQQQSSQKHTNMSLLK